jgi:plasmid stability protein
MRIRGIDERTMDLLRNRAARNGRSLEDEAYEIILHALDEPGAAARKNEKATATST